MARSLILHIGAHKTGTTSIQRQLHVHREQLKSAGIYYCGAFPDYQTNHSIPVASMFRQRPEDYRQNIRAGRDATQCQSFNESNRQALTEAIESIPDGSYVISGEDIAGLREQEIDQLGRYTDHLFAEVRVVYCVRSPADLLRTIYLERLKNGTVTRNSFAANGLNRRYVDVPRRFAAAFGAQNIQVYRYEDALAYGDAVSYFFEQVLGNTDCQPEHVLHNRSISANAATALSAWNSLLSSSGKDSILNSLVRKILQRIPGSKFTSELAIDPEEAARIDNAIAALNREFGVPAYPPLGILGSGL